MFFFVVFFFTLTPPIFLSVPSGILLQEFLLGVSSGGATPGLAYLLQRFQSFPVSLIKSILRMDTLWVLAAQRVISIRNHSITSLQNLHFDNPSHPPHTPDYQSHTHLPPPFIPLRLTLP